MTCCSRSVLALIAVIMDYLTHYLMLRARLSRNSSSMGTTLRQHVKVTGSCGSYSIPTLFRTSTSAFSDLHVKVPLNAQSLASLDVTL